MSDSYFTYAEENKYKLRMSLVFLITSNVIRNRTELLNKQLTTVVMLNNLKELAKKKEDYEMVELINDILKNRDYQVYGV